MRKMLILALATGLLGSGACFAQLSGSYTIDPNGSGSRNYTSFRAAISALNAGVNGAVTFNVSSTTFNETVSITAISGASSTNNVTFKATGAPATIDAGNGADAVVLAQNTQWVTLENLKIINFSTHGLRLQGSFNSGADNNTFTSIEIDGPSATSSTVRALSVEYSNANTFSNIIARGGGRVFYSQQMNRNLFESCEFDGKNTATNLLAPFNSNDADNVFQNCFMHSCGQSGIGAYINLSSYGNMFWHNTIIVSSSGPAAWMGGCCAWSRACSWRNNIIVNQGSGPAVRYGESRSTMLLDRFDADYNCYYAPNATNTVETEQGSFKGSLAGWQTYLANNMNKIQPGGGTSYDQNSLEVDPGLVSINAPYDIHLTGASPLQNAGTTQYVAGPWISYNQNATVPTDFEGDQRGSQVDIGADEVSFSIIGSGVPSPGRQIQFDLLAAADAGLPYITGSSFGTGPIPIGNGRQLNLSLDQLMDLTVNQYAPNVFVNYVGFLNAQGRAQARLNIPNFPQLTGLAIHTAFITLKNGAPLGINGASNTFSFTIQ